MSDGLLKKLEEIKEDYLVFSENLGSKFTYSSDISWHLLHSLINSDTYSRNTCDWVLYGNVSAPNEEEFINKNPPPILLRTFYELKSVEWQYKDKAQEVFSKLLARHNKVYLAQPYPENHHKDTGLYNYKESIEYLIPIELLPDDLQGERKGLIIRQVYYDRLSWILSSIAPNLLTNDEKQEHTINKLKEAVEMIKLVKIPSLEKDLFCLKNRFRKLFVDFGIPILKFS